MFEKLVVSNSISTQVGRQWYFLSSSAVLCAALVTGLVLSLYSKELNLGAGDLVLTQLVAPAEPPVVEPEPPPPVDPPQQPQVKDQSIEEPPTRSVIIQRRATRRINMARLDETPPAVPKEVSTRPNTYAARLDKGKFELGKVDLGGGTGPGRASYRGTSRGTGSGQPAAGENASGVKTTAPPPPPIKKTPKVKKSITRSLGVINGKATSLPKPKYPAAAQAVRARGKVNVRVVINENGRVASADAVSGHPLLRSAAEAAARNARFSPTLLSGVPVKISGVIVYNFLG